MRATRGRLTRRYFVGLAAAAPLSAAWTGFRGGRRTGRADEGVEKDAWSASGLDELWRRPVGGGFSSVALGGGHGYSADVRNDEQAVFAFEPSTGEEVWAHRWETSFGARRGFISTIVQSGKGPRATPTWHAGVVYAAGPAGEVVALDDSSGEPLWQRNIQDDLDAKGSLHGVASSPLVMDDLVVLMPGRAEESTVVALDRETGELRWGALSEPAAYISPMAATLGGRRQIVAGSQNSVVGLDPASGRLLWRFPWKSGDWAAQPLPLGANGLLLADGSECARIDIVTDGGGLQARELWRNINLKAGYSSPVTDGSLIYGFDKSFLACLDPKSGERLWKGGRYGRGQLILAGQDLLVLTEDGDIVSVAATGAAHEESGRFRAVEGRAYACPALDGGRLFIRGDKELACFQASAPRV